jgi:hypothetical protein
MTRSGCHIRVLGAAIRQLPPVIDIQTLGRAQRSRASDTVTTSAPCCAATATLPKVTAVMSSALIHPARWPPRQPGRQTGELNELAVGPTHEEDGLPEPQSLRTRRRAACPGPGAKSTRGPSAAPRGFAHFPPTVISHPESRLPPPSGPSRASVANPRRARREEGQPKGCPSLCRSTKHPASGLRAAARSRPPAE